jgi:hypothetical protein
MVRRGFYTTAVFVLTTLVVGVDGVRADPLVVTSGFFTITDGPVGFRFVGQDFDIRADFVTPFIGPPGPGNGNFGGGIGPWETCFTCEPGTTIELGSRASGPIGQWTDRPDLPNRFDGMEYPTVFFSGDLRFDAPTGTAPPITAGVVGTHLTAPFLFSGQLTAFGTRDRTGPPLFSVLLTGRGDTEVIIGLMTTGSSFEFEDLNYRFTNASASPTPEPATFMLVAGGLLSAHAIRRRRRQPEA